MSKTTITFKRVFLNPANLKARGIATNIIVIRQKGDIVEVEFEKEPTRGEIEQILALLRQNRWEVQE